MNLFIPELGKRRQGKVRDIYEGDHTLTLIASDRVSIFDLILHETIPDKGRILTELSLFWFEQTRDIIPNHMISHPDPDVMIVKKCQAIPVEMIVRGFLVGSMWRDYALGKRTKCGVPLPDGLQENDPLPFPIITPTTKSHEGHDLDISAQELIDKGVVSKELWERLSDISLKLYQRGLDVVAKRGLILVDTKYEFGLDQDGQLILIDEIHTPDSSRYWYKEDLARKQIRFPDKEFVREWGRSQGFTGDGDIPHLPKEMIERIRENYIKIYHTITGKTLDEQPKRLICNLRHEKLIKGYFCALQVDDDRVKKVLDEHQIPYQVIESFEEIDQSIEPVVILGETKPKTKWPFIKIGENPEEAAYEAIKRLRNMEVP